MSDGSGNLSDRNSTRAAVREPIEILCLDTARRIGGGQVSIERLLRNLDPARFRVTLACPRHSALGDRFALRGATRLEWLPTSRAVRVARFDPLASGISRRILLPFAAGAAIARLALWLRRRPRAVIHANTFQAATIGAILSIVTGRLLIFHDRILRSHGLIESWVRSRASVILAITEVVAAKWRDRAASRTRLLIDGTELDPDRAHEPGALRSRLGIDPSANVVLVVARISPEKRIMDVIEALGRLRRDTVLLIAGEPYLPEDVSYARKLAALAGERGVRCEFLGFVEHLQPVYYASDVFVLPTLAEAFGQVVIEAMVTGRAIVAARNGGPLEILDDGRTGLFFTPGDAGDLAEKLDRLLADPALRLRLGSAARLDAEERFGIAKTVARFTEIVEELVEPRPR
ncbi:MAG: glycosyltransferase family 4 protein [bacterium]